MSEHAKNEDCIKLWTRFEQLEKTAQAGEACMKEAEVTKQKVVVLEKGFDSAMQDIKDIKKDITTIRGGLYEIKIWILTAVVAMLLTACGQMLYYGGKIYQVDNHEKRIEKLEAH